MVVGDLRLVLVLPRMVPPAAAAGVPSAAPAAIVPVAGTIISASAPAAAAAAALSAGARTRLPPAVAAACSFFRLPCRCSGAASSANALLPLLPLRLFCRLPLLVWRLPLLRLWHVRRTLNAQRPPRRRRERRRLHFKTVHVKGYDKYSGCYVLVNKKSFPCDLIKLLHDNNEGVVARACGKLLPAPRPWIACVAARAAAAARCAASGPPATSVAPSFLQK